MKTKVSNNSSTLYDKLDYLYSDVTDGTISANSTCDRIEKIQNDIEKILASL